MADAHRVHPVQFAEADRHPFGDQFGEQFQHARCRILSRETDGTGGVRAFAEDRTNRPRTRLPRPDFDERTDAIAVGTLDDGREIDRVQQPGGDRVGGGGFGHFVLAAPRPAVYPQPARCRHRQAVEFAVRGLNGAARFAMCERHAFEQQEPLAERGYERFHIRFHPADNAFVRRGHDQQVSVQIGSQVQTHIVRRDGHDAGNPIERRCFRRAELRPSGVERWPEVGAEQRRFLNPPIHFIAARPEPQPEQPRRFAEALPDQRIGFQPQTDE